MSNTLAIVMTGGTISRIGAEKHRHLDNTYIHGFITDARFDFPIHVVDICAKFSLALTDDDKQRMIQEVKHTNTNKVIVTCGTDTMVQLAQLLAEHVKNKIVIVTGSMVPYKHARSDARMNLACSCAFAQTQNKSGVWICMQGRLFDPFHTQKDVKHKKFVQTK